MYSLKSKLALCLGLIMIIGTMSACSTEVKKTESAAVESTTEVENTKTAESSTAETTAAEPVKLNPDGIENVIYLDDEHAISYGALCMSVLQQKSYFESMTMEYYNRTVTVEDWNTPMENGHTPAEDIFDQTMEAAISQLVVASKADEYQVSISEEELDSLEKENADLYQAFPARWLEMTGLTEADWLELSKQAMLYDKVKEAELADFSTEITDEEARTMKMGMFAIALDGTNPGKGLPTKEEAEVKVQEILSIIEEGANPKAVIEEYGYSYVEDSMYVGQFADENSVKMMALKTGETMYFSTDEMAVYAVICLDEADTTLTEERKTVLAEEAAESFFAQLVTEWVAESEIQKNEELIGKMDLFSE